MRADWASFAASGNPSTRALPWPSFGDGGSVLSLVPAQSAVETNFAAAHHCSFWAAGKPAGPGGTYVAPGPYARVPGTLAAGRWTANSLASILA